MLHLITKCTMWWYVKYYLQILVIKRDANLLTYYVRKEELKYYSYRRRNTSPRR